MPEMALLIHPRNMETLEGKLIEFYPPPSFVLKPHCIFLKNSLFKNNYQSWKLSSHEVS